MHMQYVFRICSPEIFASTKLKRVTSLLSKDFLHLRKALHLDLSKTEIMSSDYPSSRTFHSPGTRCNAGKGVGDIRGPEDS